MRAVQYSGLTRLPVHQAVPYVQRCRPRHQPSTSRPGYLPGSGLDRCGKCKETSPSPSSSSSSSNSSTWTQQPERHPCLLVQAHTHMPRPWLPHALPWPARRPPHTAPVHLSSAPFTPCQSPSRGINVVISYQAICTSSRGQHAEAVQLFWQALELCDRALGGAEHPDNAATRTRLAACHDGRGGCCQQHDALGCCSGSSISSISNQQHEQ